MCVTLCHGLIKKANNELNEKGRATKHAAFDTCRVKHKSVLLQRAGAVSRT
jgi:hypothetical protein